MTLGETMTMAPIVIDGRAYVGNAGADFGVRGWLACLDIENGKELWRAWSTGSDKDCLIGDKFKPFYESDRGHNLGLKSWPPGRWQTGGGRVWGWISYDPELDLIYYGTSNPAPWNAGERAGDNKWTSGIFARTPATGQARWFYQYSPHDLWDHDGINESVVLDLEISGSQRKTLVHPDRNGYVYVLDRTTGEVISATPFVRITAYKGVDLKTGRLQENAEKAPSVGKVVHDVAPSRTRRQGLVPVGLVATHQTAVHAALEHVDGPRTNGGQLHRRYAVCLPQLKSFIRRLKDTWANSRLGIPWRRNSPGRSTRSSRSGAERWPLPPTSSSMEPWKAGSRRWTPVPASCFGSSKRVRASSGNRSLTAVLMVSNTWRSFLELAAGQAL